jgi:hypothetical protein
MTHHGHAITRAVHISLDILRTKTNRGRESEEGVLWSTVTRGGSRCKPAMGEHAWQIGREVCAC